MKLKAYAKLNLSLDVKGVREDGYHELDMIMQSISLCDFVKIAKSEKLRVMMDKGDIVETDNTAYKAAHKFMELTGTCGAFIYIEKHIPPMSGLGGASADAAAVIKGLDTLYGTQLSKEEMLDLAVSVGADVPFALTGGMARANGIGEILQPLKPDNLMYYVVVKPFQGVSTAEAFLRYKQSAHVSIDSVEYAALKGDAKLFSRFAGNALGMASLSIAPDIMKAINALSAAGETTAVMTGSGSAVFAAFQTEELSRRAELAVRGRFELCGAYAPVDKGVEIIEE